MGTIDRLSVFEAVTEVAQAEELTKLEQRYGQILQGR